MKRLIFDTSTELMYIAIEMNGKIINQKTMIGSRSHGRLLVPSIQELLNETKMKTSDLKEIIVGYGPGSYTGIRVSVMVAKMLSYSLDIPLRVISSLLLLTSGYDEAVIAMMDARNDNYFAGIYNNGINTLLDDGLYNIEQINDFMKFKRVVLTAKTVKININKVIKNAIHIDDIDQLEPNYLRKTEAERNEH